MTASTKSKTSGTKTTRTRTRKPKHPLASMVPPKRDNYVHRVLLDYKDVDLLAYAKEAGLNTLLFGPTGPGKTVLVEQYAAMNDYPLATLLCNGAIDPTTVWVTPRMVSANELVFEESDALKIIRHGGVLYIDEINFMPPKISAALHSLLDSRRSLTIIELGGELVKAHEDLQVIAAYNPDYIGTVPMNPALRNRFPLKISFDYDTDVEEALVEIPTMIEIAQEIRRRRAQGDFDTDVSTNMLIEFCELAVDLGLEQAMTNFTMNFPREDWEVIRSVFELNHDKLDRERSELMAQYGE